MIVLETGRLMLRRFTELDLGHLIALNRDPEMMRYLDKGQPIPAPNTVRSNTPSTVPAGRLTHGPQPAPPTRLRPG